MSIETKKISELEELENLDNRPYFLVEEEGVAKRVPTRLVEPVHYTDYEALVVATEIGFIDPVIDENGAILVDENGAILTL